MKNRFLMWFVVALIANGVSLRIANAQSFTTLDPNLFASGQNISNGFQGLTLQTMSLVATPNTSGLNTQWTANYAPVYAAGNMGFQTGSSGFPPGNVFSSASGGSVNGWGELFAPQINFQGNCFLQCTGTQGYNFGTNLLVNFSTPVNEISVLQDGNAYNGVVLEAFNSSNQEVGYCEASPGMPQGPGNYGCYSVSSPAYSTQQWQVGTSIQANDITKVLMGGDNSPGDQVEKIRYEAAPAPEIDPTSAASGLTLLLGGLFVLRGRRAIETRTI